MIRKLYGKYFPKLTQGRKMFKSHQPEWRLRSDCNSELTLVLTRIMIDAILYPLPWVGKLYNQEILPVSRLKDS